MEVKVERHITEIQIIDVELPYFFKIPSDSDADCYVYGKVEEDVTTVLEQGSCTKSMHVYKVPAEHYSWAMSNPEYKIGRKEFDDAVAEFLDTLFNN